MHLRWPPWVGGRRRRKKHCVEQKIRPTAQRLLQARRKPKALQKRQPMRVSLRPQAGICRRMKPMPILCWIAWCN